MTGVCVQCGQPIEYGSAETGHVIPCPKCHQPLDLTAVKPPALPAAKISPLELAFLEFEKDPQFTGRLPTREQVGRAWAYAKFKNPDPEVSPRHDELVKRLKELFREFRSHAPKIKSSRSNRWD